MGCSGITLHTLKLPHLDQMIEHAGAAELTMGTPLEHEFVEQKVFLRGPDEVT